MSYKRGRLLCVAEGSRKQEMHRVEPGIYRRGHPKTGTLYVSVWNSGKGKKGGKDWYSGAKHGFDTIPKARKFRREKQTELDKGKQPLVKTDTIEQWHERWLEVYPRPKRVTNDLLAERAGQFVKVFGKRKLDGGVSHEEAQAWANDNIWAARHAKTMMQDAVRARLAQENPFDGVKLPREVTEGRENIVVLDDEELERLVQIAQRQLSGGRADGDPSYGVVFGAFIRVAAYTGMRPSEMYALRWSDVDFEKGFIHVRRQYRSKTKEIDDPKADSKRTIPMAPQVVAALQDVPRIDGQEEVWFTKTGKPISQRVMHYYWDPVRSAFWETLPGPRQEQIPRDFDFYELRHFFGTYLAEMNPPCSPYEIALLMGHKDGGRLAMKRYIHIAEEKALERIKKRMGDQLRPDVDERGSDEATG